MGAVPGSPLVTQPPSDPQPSPTRLHPTTALPAGAHRHHPSALAASARPSCGAHGAPLGSTGFWGSSRHDAGACVWVSGLSSCPPAAAWLTELTGSEEEQGLLSPNPPPPAQLHGSASSWLHQASHPSGSPKLSIPSVPRWGLWKSRGSRMSRAGWIRMPSLHSVGLRRAPDLCAVPGDDANWRWERSEPSCNVGTKGVGCEACGVPTPKEHKRR